MGFSEIEIAPENSLVFVADPTWHYELSREIGEKFVAATDSSVAVSALSSLDGTTIIKLGRLFENPQGTLVFDAQIETPGRVLAVTGVGDVVLLSMPVSGTKTHVRIWTNHPSEPDLILIEAQ